MSEKKPKRVAKRFRFPFMKAPTCKHPNVQQPIAAAAIPVKVTCPDCGAVGVWNWDEERLEVPDVSVDPQVVRTSTAGREPGADDEVQRMMPRADGDE
jgi:hypothetical protein